MCAYFAVLQLEGKVKWEGMWVIFVECIAYGAAYVSPDADFVSIHLTNGNVSSHLVARRGCAAQKHRAAASSTQGRTQGYTQGCSGRSGTWHKRTASPQRQRDEAASPPPPRPARHHPTLTLTLNPSTARAGMWVEWMRYAGWILTCPVLLMTLVSIGVGFEPTLLPTQSPDPSLT